MLMFRINPASGKPIYLQLMQQVRHAIETGSMQHGDQLPGIRTLAEELVVSPHTVAKAYSELEHEGLIELRQGTGAFIAYRRRVVGRASLLHEARQRFSAFIDELRTSGLRDDEIQRIFEAELFHPAEEVKR